MEFDFDLAADTAYSVASEMVSDLSLSHQDAKVCHLLVIILLVVFKRDMHSGNITFSTNTQVPLLRDLCMHQVIARAIKEEIMALTEGSSPHRRYACIFSDDEDAHLNQASGQDGAVQMAVETAAGGGKQAAGGGQQAASGGMQQSSHAGTTYRQSGEWASLARQLNDGTQSEGCCSMMTLDNGGVSSPGANAGSDASMMSRCNSAEAVEESAQSALIGRKRSSSKLNPPKDEDRTLPMKKLFENLTELSNAEAVRDAAVTDHGLLSNASSTAPFLNASAPKAASVAGDLPHVAVPHSLGPLRGIGALGRVPSVSESLNGVELGKPSSQKGSPVRSFRTTLESPGRSVASFARNPWSSSDSLHQGSGQTPAGGGLLHNLSQVRTRAVASHALTLRPVDEQKVSQAVHRMPWC